MCDTPGCERHPDLRAAEEEASYREMQRRADGIASLIVTGEHSLSDIARAREQLREHCRRIFPDRVDLYEMIYEARFRRLWEQFRAT